MSAVRYRIGERTMTDDCGVQTSDLNQKLDALAKLSTQIVNKADIDYVDEVNDIASMREVHI